MMSEVNGTEQYRQSLKAWVGEVTQAWNDWKRIETNEREGGVHNQFEEALQSLDQALNYEENVHIAIEDLSKRANVVHQLWQGIVDPTGDLRKEKTDTSLAPVPIGGHRLPPLPYAYDALEPYIAEEIMRLHHSKHHQTYVDGLNKAEKEMEKARKTGDFDLIKHWEREAAFHGAGHYLHTIFWNIMSPRGGGNPVGELAHQINRDFGNFRRFKQHFSNAAKEVEAVGWAILVWAPRSHRLEILQAEKHQNLSQWDVIPILVLDVWEHAYYLQYKNERKAYVDNWWNVVDWESANRRFVKASQLLWEPF